MGVVGGNLPEPVPKIGAEVRGPRFLSGGIVAHNDELRIEAAICSLLGQALPLGTQWTRIWVVASGCTDRTVEVARALEAEDPRLRVLVQPTRRGKASAIREVLERAEGDALVLLNSDAVAAPGAVAELLRTAAGKPPPFAVMARPTVPATESSGWSRTMRWMWDLHHELHLEMLADGRGAHLSDELFLVSLPALPWIEEGVINDGSFCAVWLRQHAGGCWYAPEARVTIDIPRAPRDHLRQRRRIHVGNLQIAERLGRSPTTAVRYLFEHPTQALRAFRRAVAKDHGARHLLRIAGWEVVAHLLAAWDRLPPRRDHVLWSRISSSGSGALGDRSLSAVSPDPARERDLRIRTILEVAREFGTGVPLQDLIHLLPHDGPGDTVELAGVLRQRPDLAAVVWQSAFAPATDAVTDSTRRDRGTRYRQAARDLFDGPLAWLRPSIRCAGITGSAAYGEPAEGDDLDFFVVTRSGELFWVLAGTYLSLRLEQLRHGRASDPSPCFNYVVDERRAPREFAGGRGMLFAREALTAQMVQGDAYYRGLLRQIPWLGNEFPRLYAVRTASGEETPLPRSLIGKRFASAALFLPLAAYLQLGGLRRNAAARRAGRDSDQFRTLTYPGRMAFQSRRFEELRARYDGTPRPTPARTTTGGPSRIPTLR